MLWILLFFLLAIQVQSNTCTIRLNCLSYTTHLAYVDCVSGHCVCLTNQGFTGNATLTSKCDCADGNTVRSEAGSVYCLSLALATLLQVNQSLGEFYVSQAKEVYTNLIYPIPLEILNGSLSVDNLFAPGVIGRVDPLGIFNGKTFSDYFYVFAVMPGIPAIQVGKVTFPKSAVNLTGPLPVVSIRVDIGFSPLGVPDFIVQNVTESGTFTFAPNGTILTADLIIHNVGFATDPTIKNRTAFVESFCTDYFTFCNRTTDPLGYYNTSQQCFNTLFDADIIRQETFLGSTNVTYDQAGGNTMICRRVHLSIARFDPSFHCPHAGQTGGGQCTDAAGVFGPNPGPYYTNYYTPFQSNF
jgi:hypothetical protein